MDSFFSLSLLKPTLFFLFNLRRLWRLLFIPLCGFVLLSLVVFRYPLFALAETAELSYDVNFFLIFISLCFLCFLALYLMYEVHKVIFFGLQKEEEEKKIYEIHLDKGFFRYLFGFVRMFLSAFFVALLIGSFALLLLKSFFSLEGSPYLYALGISGFLLPYFLIRFSMMLPASAVNKKLSFWQAWSMTGDLGIFYLFCYIFAALFPLLLAFSIAPFMGDVENSLLLSLFNFVTFTSLFLSCITQASYLSYSFAALDKA